MPKLIRMYIINVVIGFGIAAGFVAMLLYFNIANLWHLVTHSDKGWLAVLVLWFANGIVFAGGVQFAIAVMKMKDDDDDGPGGVACASMSLGQNRRSYRCGCRRETRATLRTRAEDKIRHCQSDLAIQPAINHLPPAILNAPLPRGAFVMSLSGIKAV